MKKIIYLVPTLSLVGCTSQRVEEKPNVIVILADDPVSYTHLTLPTTELV